MARSAKGRISTGYDADFTPCRSQGDAAHRKCWIASQCGWTPFDGVECTGWPVATIVRGRIVMRDGAVAGAPAGRAVTFS